MGKAFLFSSQVVAPHLFHNGLAWVSTHLQKQAEAGWTAMVTSVSICRSPLEDLPSVYHHFLIVEVTNVLDPSRPGCQDSSRQLIRAEKVGAEKAGTDENGEHKGIIVKYVPVAEEMDYQIFHRVDAIGVNIKLAELVPILIQHSPNYDLMRDNCWKYADATLKNLLTTLVDLYPKDRPEDRSRMVGQLQAIPPLLMPDDIVDPLIAGVGMTLLITFLFKLLKAVWGSRH